MSREEIISPEVLPCLMKVDKSAVPVPLGKQYCQAFPGCSFELSVGLFGKVSAFGGCAQEIETRRRDKTGDDPTFGAAVTSMVIDVEPRP